MPGAPKYEWRELLIDVAPPPLSLPTGSDGTKGKGPAEFQFAISRGLAQHALVLPTRDPRARELLDVPSSTVEMSA
jgi:hypothetical protein